MRNRENLFVWVSIGLFFVSINSFSQNMVTGIVRDAVTRDFLASIHVFDEENIESGTLTNSKGKFSLEIAEFPVVLSLTAVGYHRKDLVITHYPDFALELELIPATIQIDEVAITGERYQRYLKEEAFYIKDYAFTEDFIWLTGYPQKNILRPELRVLSFSGRTLARESTGKRPELFPDALGNVHLIQDDSVFQLHYDGEIRKYYPQEKDESLENLLALQHIDSKGAVIKKTSGEANLIEYWKYVFIDSTEYLLHASYDRNLFDHSESAKSYKHGSIPSTEGKPGPSHQFVQLQELRSSNPQLMLMSDTQIADWIQNKTGKPSTAGAGDWSSPTGKFTNYAMNRLLIYKPIISRYFILDTCNIIFEDRDYLLWVYFPNRELPEFYHLELPEEASELNMIQDKTTLNLYATYSINGLCYIAKIDPLYGEVKKTADLKGFAFVENIQVHGGRVYFTHQSPLGRRTMNLYSFIF